MAILKFSFSAIGDTRQKVTDEIDGKVNAMLLEVGGEPWVVITDEIRKICVNPRDFDDPRSFVYLAQQEVVFTGPSPLGKQIDPFRDGFRPQVGDEDRDDLFGL